MQCPNMPRVQCSGWWMPIVAAALLLPIAGRYVWAQTTPRAPLSKTEKDKLLADAHTLCEQAGKFGDEGKPEEAIPLLQQAVTLRTQVLGLNHRDTAEALQALGLSFQNARRYAEARQCYEQTLSIRNRVLGETHLDTAAACANLAWLLYTMENNAGARPYYEQVLAIRRKLLGDKHPDVAKALHNLGVLLDEMGDHATARPHLEQALAIRREVLGDKHPETASSLNCLGSLHLSMDNYAAARTCYEQALAIRREALGDTHPETGTALNNLGLALKYMGDLAAARTCFEEALTICRATRREKHAETAAVLDNLGSLLEATRDFPAARVHLEQALAIRQEVLGDSHPATANSLGDLGSVFYEMEDYSLARSYYEKELAIWRKTLGENHRQTARVLNDLGGAHHALGDYAAARAYYEQSLAIRKALQTDKDPETAQTLNSLGTLHESMGDYAAARASCERALAIYEETLGDTHPDTADVLNNLGDQHDSLGDYAVARGYYERALAVRKKALGDRHPDTALTLNNLGVLLNTLGDYAAARRCHEQALAIRQEVRGKKHRDTAESLHNLGALLEATGDYAAARSYYEQALAIRMDPAGTAHADAAISLNNLGMLLFALGDHRAARPYLEQALAMKEEWFGESHPDTALSRNNLAILHAATGDWPAAADAMERVRRFTRRHAMRALPTLSENEQRKFLEMSGFTLEHALSLGLARRDDERLCSSSAGWLINGKAGAQEALALRTHLTGPNAEYLLAQLRAVRNNLARMTHQSLPADQEPGRREQLALVRRQEEELIRKLGDLTLGAAAEDQWIPLERLRDQLAPDAIHINIARFDVFDFGARNVTKGWQSARYAAWLVPPQGRGPVKIVDLGAAAPIDRAVSDARQAIQETAMQMAKQDEATLEREARQSLWRLSKLLLAPLLPHVGDAARLVISPDGQLWLAPWGALVLADGRYAAEQYEISFAISGRELAGGSIPLPLGESAATIRPTAPLILADPDFDLQPSSAAREARNVDAAPQRGGSAHRNLPLFNRLAFTALEARAIAPSIERYTKAAPKVALGAEAQEGVFKSSRGPRVLTFSTHGFFLPDQVTGPLTNRLDRGAARSAALTTEGKALENPLLRCGLVLAGCNRRSEASAGGEDGLLTGLEIAGADLRGTELVVLSACETGVGEVQNGEGVAGLRQAFQLAGAEAVIASLWSVDDRDTARLMKSFFEHVAAGKSKSAALRAAQLDRIASRRERFEAAHPFYWAAFTVTGK